MSTTTRRSAPRVVEKPDVLLAQADDIRPGDEVVYTQGQEHVAVRPVQVEVDPDAGTVLLVPRGRDECLLPSAHPVIIIRGTPAA